MIDAKPVRNLSDLSDSKLLYEKKIPPFGFIIVLVVAGLLIGVLIWSLVTPKVYIVKGSGVIESANKNYIMSSYAGEIRDMSVKNGDYVEKGDPLFTLKSTELNLQQIQIDGTIEIYKKQIAGFLKLEKSVKDNRNYFDANNTDDKQFYNQYETYRAQIKQNSFDVNAYRQYGYTDAQIEVELRKVEGKNSEIYYSTLQSINESISAAQSEIDNLEVQSEAIAAGQAEYKITAVTGGIVHMNADYKDGMVIGAGSAIGSIANENDTYVIRTYINVNDMPRVNVGDSVDIAVSGLMESVYGTVPGRLIKIDSDITTLPASTDKSEGSGSYFRLEIEPDASYLISGTGRKYNFSNGTAVETKIKYDEVSYFDFFLESLGLLGR